MWEFTPSIFPTKVCYEMDHTNKGIKLEFLEIADAMKRKFRCDNMHLIGNMKFTQENGFPILQPFNTENLDFELYSYSERRKHSDKPWAVHFFQNDYIFLKAITDRLELTTQALYDCTAIFAPDCSLYVNGPTFINKQNLFRSRFAAAYWQSCGYNVIQTASWGNANSLKYAFDGLAENSITAVCGIGHDFCEGAKRLWRYAIRKLVETKTPTKLIIYGGKADDLPQLGIPVVYVEDYITQHFRKNCHA